MKSEPQVSVTRRATRRVTAPGYQCLVALVGMVTGVAVARGVAQTPSASPVSAAATTLPRLSLTVRPHDMATGTTNPPEGTYQLDSLPEMSPEVQADPYRVYVPAKCAGAHRCPLIMHLHGAGRNSESVKEYVDVADEYGMIVLAPTAVRRMWTIGHADSFSLSDFERDRKNIDAALQQVLRKYAIDPDKIAISGVSMGCWPAIALGGRNMDVFSRTITFGEPPLLSEVDPPNAKAEFLAVEEFTAGAGQIWKQHNLEHAGYRAKLIASAGMHGVGRTDVDFVGQWLRDSWAQPNPAKRRPPRVLKLPVLTSEGLAKYLAVEGMVYRVPIEDRLEYMRETVVPIVTEHPSNFMTDMPALAANLPEIATALKKAGLTAAQFDAYHVALLSARFTLEATEGWAASRLPPGTVVDPASVMGRNMAFLKAHPKESEEMFGPLR